jgi:2-phospho-L-lactate guanylyltransferase
LIPVKPFQAGKSRLAPVLGAHDRHELNRQLLERTIAVAQATRLFDQIAVISRSHELLALAAAKGLLAIQENGRGLNPAVTQGVRVAGTGGAAGLLLLPADLPLLEKDDLGAVCEPWRSGRADAVLTPSHDGGTSALLTPVPPSFAFAYGKQSFSRHQTLIQRAGLRLAIVERLRLAADLDTPADWTLLQPALTSVR